MKLTELDFSCRVANCLIYSEGIETVDDLCKLSGIDLLRLPNFGPTSLREVRSRLASVGRRLLGDQVPTTKAAPPHRYGIIPCRRCAFWTRILDTDIGDCRLSRPNFVKVHEDRRLETPTGWWPTTVGTDDGCGDGLLREEAAPLPPEKEPKP